MASIVRHKTAIHRSKLSRPIALAIRDGLVTPSASIFDYGCGRGDDIQLLKKLGYSASGWDPAFFPRSKRLTADVVNLGYVINVIEDSEERELVLKDAWKLARKILIVSARLNKEALGTHWKRYNDGWLTRNGTFQKFYSPNELINWVGSRLYANVHSPSPGIVYAFKAPILDLTSGN